jgi:hypothetical protein
MAQITSRAKLEEWLINKPVEWAQVIAARAALRALPYAFAKEVPQKWIEDYAIVLIRAIFISWTIPNFPTHEVTRNYIAREINSTISAFRAATYAAALASNSRVAAYVGAGAAVHAATTAARGVFGDLLVETVGDALADALATERATAVWRSINQDCNRLKKDSNRTAAAESLTCVKLWTAHELSRWGEDWEFAYKRIGALRNGKDGPNQHYQVWIDWYNRRIEGHEAAFDIPGDIDRVYDKTILARLADATDEDFWGKGATYVNTTLQSWIDEARIEARIEEIVRKLRGGAAVHYGAPEDLAGRAILIEEIDRLLSLEQRARLGIGGNHPPEPIDFVEETKALPKELRQPLEAISTELEKREPNALIVVEQVKLLHRVGRRLEKMASLALDKYAEGFGEELGKGTAKLITRAPYLAVFIMLINQILDWLAPLIR